MLGSYPTQISFIFGWVITSIVFKIIKYKFIFPSLLLISISSNSLSMITDFSTLVFLPFNILLNYNLWSYLKCLFLFVIRYHMKVLIVDQWSPNKDCILWISHLHKLCHLFIDLLFLSVGNWWSSIECILCKMWKSIITLWQTCSLQRGVLEFPCHCQGYFWSKLDNTIPWACWKCGVYSTTISTIV